MRGSDREWTQGQFLGAHDVVLPNWCADYMDVFNLYRSIKLYTWDLCNFPNLRYVFFHNKMKFISCIICPMNVGRGLCSK